jgi:hypothetical protein
MMVAGTSPGQEQEDPMDDHPASATEVAKDADMADDDPRHWTPRASDGKVYCCVTLGWVTPEVAFDHRWDTSRSPEEYEADYSAAWKRTDDG